MAKTSREAAKEALRVALERWLKDNYGIADPKVRITDRVPDGEEAKKK